MKKFNFFVILDVIFLILLLTSFNWQYEHLFMTKITIIIFVLIHLLFEIKKEYISINKTIFIIFSAIILITLMISIIVDNSSLNNAMNNGTYLLFGYIFVLIVRMYQDLYTEN
jgi:hypothetical protein